MNHLPLLSRLSGAALAVTMAGFLATSAHAQTIYYYDPKATGSTPGSAGTGTWDTGTTSDFVEQGTSSDTFYPLPVAYSTEPAAYFGGGSSDVTVDGTVNATVYRSAADVAANTPIPPAMEFNPGNNNTVTIDAASGGSINAVIDDEAGVPNGQAFYYQGSIIQVDSGNVTINAPINVDQADGEDSGADISNNNTGTLTLTGAMTFEGSDNGSYEGFFVSNTQGGSVVFDSTVTTENTVTPIVGNSTQPFYLHFTSGNATTIAGEFDGNIKPASSGPNGSDGASGNDILSADSGILLLDNSNYDSLNVAAGASALTNGDVTISATISTNGTIGGYKPGVSTFSGLIGENSNSYSIVAAAGGKVDVTGYITQDNGGVVQNLVSIGGPGVVDISGNTNDYNSGYRGAGYQGGGGTYGYDHYTASTDSNSYVGTDIVSGTTIISNTSGSAFGGGANQPRENATDPTESAGVNDVVDLEAGAALGGTGYSQQEIIAKAATSIITPGEMDQNGISSYGTLHLDNGLAATTGLTGNFQLGLTDSDKVEISTISTAPFTYYDPSLGMVTTVTVDVNGAPTDALTLTGNVVINLSTVAGDTIDPTQSYELFYSKTGTAWDIGGADFSFTGAPTGYTASEEYVANDGSGNEAIDVTFSEIPEPSTWVLMGLGGLILIGTGKLRKLRA